MWELQGAVRAFLSYFFYILGNSEEGVKTYGQQTRIILS